MKATVVFVAALALVMVVSLSSMAAEPAAAEHTPLNSDLFVWKDLPGVGGASAAADFNLEIVWTPGYEAQGDAYQQRVLDVAAQDPSCFDNTCPNGTYGRWYLDQAHPYFGGTPTTAPANFDPWHPDPLVACGTEGSVSFHWLSLPADLGPALGAAQRCDYGDADPARVFSAQVVVNPNPVANDPEVDPLPSHCSPGPYTWFTAGPGESGDGPMPCRTYDLMSLLAHEVGHVLGLGHYRQLNNDPNQWSVDPVCLNGSHSEDVKLGNNSDRETMCAGQFAHTKRQRTPEEHEKDALRNLYPPTGPAPSISPSDHLAEGGVGKWTVTVPRDPNRATTLQMVYGDGTWDTRSIAQGSGTTSFAISHPFPGAVTYTQHATIVETGAFAESTTTRKTYPVGCDSELDVAGRIYALSSDLQCSAADAGIEITADNVVLDLNGHKISGVAYPAVEGNQGVLISDVTGARVTDSTTTATSFGAGTIERFDSGVEIVGGSANTVEKITIADNNSKQVCWWAPSFWGRRCGTDGGQGVGIFGSSNNVVVDNKIVRNGPYAGVRVYEAPATTTRGNVIGRVSAGASPLGGGNVISDNTQSAPGWGAPAVEGIEGGFAEYDSPQAGPVNQDHGVRLEAGVTNNRVENNLVERNGLDGIAVFFAPTGNFTYANVIKGNKVNANGFHLLRHRKGDGIRVFGPSTINNATDNTVEANTVCGNAASGIRVDGGRKWDTTSGWVGVRNVIKNNVSGSGTAACPFNLKDPASSPTTNFDLYDTNVAVNLANGKLPCDSNNWTGNTTGSSYNDHCVIAP